MTVVSVATVTFGLVLLAHAAYSTHEHSALYSHLHAGSGSSLPLDIQIETLVSVFFICLGLVIGAEKLKLIAWNKWAGNIEKQGGTANPYKGLEERPGFLDIRAKRKEFAEWVREKDTVVKK